MSNTATEAGSSQQSQSRFGNYLDRVEQRLGKNWPAAMVGALALIGLSPALVPLFHWSVQIPVPVLVVFGGVIAGHELGGWCWRR